jgi:hypothetical protein
VKYQPDEDWDFQVNAMHEPVNVDLSLPHYRARQQPVDHRISMFIDAHNSPVKAKVCRHNPRQKFYLEIRAESSDVTVWLPSDFKGQIHYPCKPHFSAGFTNRIMRNARLNEPNYKENHTEDDVFVYTRGTVTFRMWDIQTCSPENPKKEAFKRIFCCANKAPETTMDWDFLLED